MKIFPLVRTLFSRILLLLSIVLFVPILCVIALIPRSIRVQSTAIYGIIQIFYRLLLLSALVPIKYKGLENLPSESAIFVANHQSSLDIPLIGRLMACKPHMWFARSELMESVLLRYMIPVFAVVVDVNAMNRAAKSLIHIIKTVRKTKGSLIIFPEGARYADGAIHDFFGGFVILAKQLGYPVVPVRLFGANLVYPLGSFVIHWHTITVLVGKPIWIEEGESADSFKERVRQWFIEQ